MSAYEPNELVRPFRIPRLGRVVNTRPSTSGSKPDGRSPLMANDKSAAAGYGRRIVPVKRKATSSTEVSKSQQPIDQILQNMIIPTGKKKIEGSPRDGANSETDSAKSFPRTGDCDPLLTKERVERHNSSQDYHTFARKGLMEALLEHKMKTGRIDPHSQIGRNIKFDVDHMTVAQPVVESPPRKGPRTPSGSPPTPERRGPSTPSESPPPATSSGSKSPSFRGRSDDSSSIAEQPVPKKIRQELSDDKNDDVLLEKIAGMAGVNVSQLKLCINDQVLQTLRMVNPTVLLATVSTVLSTIANTVKPGEEKSNDQNVAEVSSSMSPKQPDRSDNNDNNNTEAMVSSSTTAKDEIDDSVEMDLASSNTSSHSDEKQIPPLPPEPAPPPLPPTTTDTIGTNFTSEFQPCYEQKPLLTVAPNAPNQVQVIQTLMQALAIPKNRPMMSQASNFSLPPPPISKCHPPIINNNQPPHSMVAMSKSVTVPVPTVSASILHPPNSITSSHVRPPMVNVRMPPVNIRFGSPMNRPPGPQSVSPFSSPNRMANSSLMFDRYGVPLSSSINEGKTPNDGLNFVRPPTPLIPPMPLPPHCFPPPPMAPPGMLPRPPAFGNFGPNIPPPFVPMPPMQMQPPQFEKRIQTGDNSRGMNRRNDWRSRGAKRKGNWSQR